MIGVIHQPNILPRLKVLQKIASSDVWIVLDDVMFSRQDYQQRALIAPVSGLSPEARWLTLPVKLKGSQTTPIRDVSFEFNDLRTLTRKLREWGFETKPSMQIADAMISKFSLHSPLVAVSIAATLELLRIADVQKIPTVVLASSLRVSAQPKALGIVELCKLASVDSYLADSGSRNYLTPEHFRRTGVVLRWQDWQLKELCELDEMVVRNGSSLNILERSLADFKRIVSEIKLSDD